MNMRLVVVMFCLFLVACADAPKTFKVAIPASQTQAAIWPDPPERARYQYIGELIGDRNFIETQSHKTENAAVGVFRWIVGLTSRNSIERNVLQRPQSGFVDAEGRVYVTDTSRQAVFVFDKVVGKLRVLDMAAPNVFFKTPVGIAEGKDKTILVVDADLGAVFVLAASGRALGAIGKGVLNRPTGVVRDPASGKIYVADTHDHDIKVFSDQGRLLHKIGKRGNADGEFNYPTFLALKNNRLYVTDSMNARIQIFDVATSKVVQKFGERGLFVGNLVRPKGLALDNDSNIYVVESLFDSLLIFNNQGQPLMAIGGSGKNVGQFYLPAGVWTDSANNIYVADMFNGRVVIFRFLGGD